MIKKYLNLIAIISIFALLAFVYFQYQSMQQQISLQKTKIESLKAKAKVAKQNKEADCFEEYISKQKKSMLKEIDNEQKESFDANATTIYF